MPRQLIKTITFSGLMLLPIATFAKTHMPDFRRNFKLLSANSVVYRAYNDSLFSPLPEKQWERLVERRAACFRQMYKVNNKMIDEMTHYFQQGHKPIPEAAFDSLYVNLSYAFKVYDIDNYMVEHFGNLLLPHYEAKQDTAHLIPLYQMLGISNLEISRFQDPTAGWNAKKYFEANINMTPYFATLPAAARSCIPLAYINYCYTLSSLGFVSASEALTATRRFETFLEDNKARFTAQEDKRNQQFLNMIKRKSGRIHQSDKNVTHADSLAIKEMYKMSPFYQSSLADQKTKSDSIFFYHSKLEAGEMSVQEADSGVYEVTRQIFDEVEHKEDINEFDVQLLSNALEMSVEIMTVNDDVPQEERMQRTLSLCRRLVKQVQRAHIVRDPYFFESMLGKMACERNLFRYLSDDDKIQFMMELAVKAQLGTLVHVSSVEQLARVLFDGMMRNCPEQFLGLKGCLTVDDLRTHQDALRQWIGTAAAFHDLGKIGLANVITNDFRRLTEHEFKLSHLHPELALKYFSVAPVFAQYKDIALGHHKWYNGKQGYPESFDNTASPLRPVIDLVVISDCLDAATDNLNRNYRHAKTLHEVLLEMKKQAGTRYNPVMVNALLHDETLCREVERIVTEGRYHCLREVRNRFIKK